MNSTGMKVLLADDVPANQRAMKRLLERRGFEVELANNGQDAVDCFNDRGYDVVLLDLQMPKMDGYEATRAIRNSNTPTGPTVPIIAMSARGSESDRQECIAAGMNACVPKPIDIEEIMNTIENLLEQGDQLVAERSVFGEEVHNVPILDLDDTRRRLQGDESLLQLFYEQFEAHAQALSKDIQAAAVTNDLVFLSNSAHRLRGIAANLGAVQLRELLAGLERIAREADAENVDEQMKPLIKSLPKAIESVRCCLRTQITRRVSEG